jgi:hypothetical protein
MALTTFCATNIMQPGCQLNNFQVLDALRSCQLLGEGRHFFLKPSIVSLIERIIEFLKILNFNGDLVEFKHIHAGMIA